MSPILSARFCRPGFLGPARIGHLCPSRVLVRRHDARTTAEELRPMPESVHSSPPWSRTTKAIMASAALILLALAIWRFSDFIAPIATAVILAYLLNPLINFVQKKITVSRGRAVLVVYVVIILLLVGGGFAIAIATAQQTADLVENLPDLLVTAVGVVQREAREVWNTDLALGPFQVNPATSLSQLDARNAVNQLLGMLEPVLTRSGTLAASVAQAAVRFASLALLVFALSIYVARDFPKIGRTISDFAHQPGYRHDADRLLKDFARIWDAYLRGQVVLGLTIGAVVTISLLILGVNNALGLGALAGLLEFLPIVGPLISTLAVILVTLFQGSHIWGLSPLWHALIVGIVMLLIQQLENNILVPRIVGKALDLHPLITMVAVLMGASLAGILGAILAAPVIATIKLLGNYGWRKMLDLPPFADLPGPPRPLEPIPESAPPPQSTTVSPPTQSENTQ